jgi:TrwC relaxase
VVWAAVMEGNQAVLDHLQQHAGYTRSGSHARKAGQVSTGQWEDAHRFVVASFRQHTSRNGDPQLHVHNTILNCVQRERDGPWRTLDGAALYRERGRCGRGAGDGQRAQPRPGGGVHRAKGRPRPQHPRDTGEAGRCVQHPHPGRH